MRCSTSSLVAIPFPQVFETNVVLSGSQDLFKTDFEGTRSPAVQNFMVPAAMYYFLLVTLVGQPPQLTADETSTLALCQWLKLAWEERAAPIILSFKSQPAHANVNA
jgi:hypothetical protein